MGHVGRTGSALSRGSLLTDSRKSDGRVTARAEPDVMKLNAGGAFRTDKVSIATRSDTLISLRRLRWKRDRAPAVKNLNALFA